MNCRCVFCGRSKDLAPIGYLYICSHCTKEANACFANDYCNKSMWAILKENYQANKGVIC